MKRMGNFAKQGFHIFALCAGMAIAYPQTFTTLDSFKGQLKTGTDPSAKLVQATNGDLYGTTQFGGAYGEGAVFKITPSGALTTLHTFCAQSGCPDGSQPEALIRAANGDLYGTTQFGGSPSAGWKVQSRRRDGV
jgi:uncharacterized repeat protein (TIGR03803 family)